jgi:hypothetical protein
MEEEMKLRNGESAKSLVQRILFGFGIVFVALLGFSMNGHAASAQKSFATADEAVKTAIAAARNKSEKET